MKKIGLLFTFLLLSSISIIAQNEHLKFMGIPITGSPNQFGKKLEEKGFVHTTDLVEDIKMYSGNFAGTNATVVVMSTNGIVHAIVVDYPKENSFSIIKSQFQNMVNQYSIKYGEPYEHIERFDPPYYEGDGCELLALEEDKCTYRATWFKELGNIRISLSKNCNLMIFYQDQEGTDEIEKSRNKKIQEDI